MPPYYVLALVLPKVNKEASRHVVNIFVVHDTAALFMGLFLPARVVAFAVRDMLDG
jgi:hypothetical protein